MLAVWRVREPYDLLRAHATTRGGRQCWSHVDRVSDIQSLYGVSARGGVGTWCVSRARLCRLFLAPLLLFSVGVWSILYFLSIQDCLFSFS